METTKEAVVNVVRLGVPSGIAQVRARTVTLTGTGDPAPAIPDTDYTSVDSVLTFGPGETTKSLKVPILTRRMRPSGAETDWSASS